MAASSRMSHPLGPRVLVWGQSCAGKTTLASHLSASLGYERIDLDALNWLPGWVGLNATDPDRLIRRMHQATRDERWVVAGSYSAQSKVAIWPRVTDVIWLDFPMHTLLWRCLRRSWHRSRSQQLLWGTCRERFWPQLKIWEKEDSLVWWICMRFHPRRRETYQYISDGTWRTARVVRLTSSRALNRYLKDIGAPMGKTFADLDNAPAMRAFAEES